MAKRIPTAHIPMTHTPMAHTPMAQAFAALLSALILTLAALPAAAGVGSSLLFSKAFAPDIIGPGSTTTLTFTIENTDLVTPASALDFIDVLPAGMLIATPSSVSTDCGDGVLTALDGGDTISLSDGMVAADSSCSVTVNVVGTSTALNTSGGLTSSAGNSGSAIATLTVDTARPGFSKSFSPSSIPRGATSTLTFTVDNTANAGGVGYLQFTDLLPTGVVVAPLPNAFSDCEIDLLGFTLNADPGVNVITYFAQGVLPSFPVMTAGSMCTVSVDVTTDTAGVFVNTSQELVIESGSDPDTAGFATAALAVPSEFLGKFFLDDPVAPGNSVTLEFTLQNPSRTEAATSIAFTDDLSFLTALTAIGLPLTEACDADGPGGSPGTGTLSGTTSLTFSGGSLPAEGSCTFSVTLAVPEGAATGTYTNTTGAVTATIDGAGVVGNTATDELTVRFVPTFTKEYLTNPVGAGGTTILRFTILNSSATMSLDEITFEDVFDDVTPTASVVPMNPVCNGGTATFTPFIDSTDGNFPATLTLTGASLSASESCTIDITMDVVTNATEGTYPNTTSQISGLLDGIEPVEGFAASDDLIVVGGPSLGKEFLGGPVDPLDAVTLEFTLTHSGIAGGPATGIAFDDDLSFLTDLAAVGLPLTEACDVDGPGGNPGTGTLSGTTLLDFSGGLLAPGESCTFSVVLTVPATALPGAHTNTTSLLTATVGGIAVTGNPASDDLRIVGLTLTKEFLDDPVIPGSTVTLEFKISNVSLNETATSIIIFDDMSAILGGLPDITGDGMPVPDVCGAGNGALSWAAGNTFMTFSGGTLMPGEMCVFSVVLDVPAGAASGTYLSTTGTGSGAGFFASMPGLVNFDEATDSLIVNDVFLDLTKEFTDDPAVPGGSTSLEFTLTNLATGAVSDLAFTDDLEAVLANLIATGLPTSACGGTVSTPDGGSTIELTGGSLAATGMVGDSCTFSLTLQVPVAVLLGSTATNTTSEATAMLAGLAVTGGPAIDDLRISALDFSKAFVTEAVAGGTVELTFTIDNLDTVAAVSDMQFSDNLDLVIPGLVATGLPALDVCGPGSALNGTSVLTLGGASLAAETSCTFSVFLQVPQAAAAGTYTNITSALLVAAAPLGVPAVADLEVVATPIVVTGVATPAGPLAECDTVRLLVPQIEVTLTGSDQPFVGADDPASYLLVSAGPDGAFATEACAGGAVGDDIPIEIVSLSLTAVDPLNVDATLVLGEPLGPDLYRLFVCDEITNAIGDPLDGDDNGTPGVDFSLPFFRADPGNLFENGHFDDCPVTLMPWIEVTTPPNALLPAAAGVDDSVASPLSASALASHSVAGASALAQCVSVEGRFLELRARVRFEPSLGVEGQLDETCEFFDGAACGGGSLGMFSVASMLKDGGGTWLFLTSDVVAPLGTASALCDFAVEAVIGGVDFGAYFDGLYFGVGTTIFIDGFESDDLSAWSSSNP